MRNALGRDILKRVSRSFYLSLVLLPKPMREPLSLGYLLARASDTIADAGSLPATQRGELLTTFRDAVENADGKAIETVRSRLRSAGELTDEGERALVEVLPECLEWLMAVDNEEMRSTIVEVLRVITGGQAWDIERFECGGTNGDLQFCANDAEIRDYTFRVAGCVGEFWTRVGFLSGIDFATDDRRETMLEAGRHYGQGLQLVNILRDMGDDLSKGRCYLPKTELIEAGWEGDNWQMNRETLMVVAEHWRKVAREWLQEGEAYSDRLHSLRIRLATRLPARLGLRTLDLLDQAGPEVLERRVKISRGVVWQELMRALLF